MLFAAAALAVQFAARRACAAEEGAIYVVDIQRVISESVAGKAARNNIEAEIKKAEAKLALMKSEFDKAREEFSKQASLLSAEALQEKKEGLQKRETALQRAAQDQREELMRKNGAELNKVVEQVQKIVDELAKSGNYPVVIEKDPRFVVYAGSRFDLTEQVVKALDTKKLQY